MKATIERTYEQLLQDLRDGYEFCGITKTGQPTGHIYMTWPQGNIGWSHYGSSANSPTPRDLEFVFENIFEDCTDWSYCEWSDEEIRYIPVGRSAA